MKRIRTRVIALVCWLVFCYSIELLLKPLGMSGITNSLGVVMMLITLIIPRAVHIPLWMILIVPIPVLLGLKFWTGTLAGIAEIPVTIMEACCIAVTILLAHRLSMAIGEIENAVAQITIGKNNRLPEQESVGQSVLYREVRRARNHQHPLALLALTVEENSIQINLERLVQEAQSAMIKQVALAGVSKTLCDKLAVCDIVVQNNDRFLVMLPETSPGDLPGLIERLRRQVMEEVGVDLIIGAASFPQDSFTLEGLVDKATRGMTAEPEPELIVELEQMSVERRVI